MGWPESSPDPAEDLPLLRPPPSQGPLLLPPPRGLEAPASRGCGPGPRLGSIDRPVCLPAGLKAFRQQLRKSTRTKGFLGLNKIKGLARQVCQPSSSSRAARGGLSAFQLPAQSPGPHGSGAGSREGWGLLEEVLHQQRYGHPAPPAPGHTQQASSAPLPSQPFRVVRARGGSPTPSAGQPGRRALFPQEVVGVGSQQVLPLCHLPKSWGWSGHE